MDTVDSDDSREFRRLCSIATRCWDAYPAQSIPDWTELVKIVLGRQGLHYDPFQLHRALTAVLRHVDQRPRPPQPEPEPPAPIDWKAVGATLRDAGILP